jgi:hypothetical protein
MEDVVKKKPVLVSGLPVPRYHNNNGRGLLRWI